MSHIWVPWQHQSAPRIAAAADALRREIDSQYSNAAFVSRPHGIVFMDGKEVAHTLKCPHCGGHFISRTGSGIRRTFCLKHGAVTCGAPACLRDCIDIYSIEGTLSVREY